MADRLHPVGIGRRARASQIKRLTASDNRIRAHCDLLTSYSCPVQVSELKDEPLSRRSHPAYLDSAIDLTEAKHVRASRPGLAADLAQADRLPARSLLSRAALHAGSWPQVAREAPAIGWGLSHIGKRCYGRASACSTSIGERPPPRSLRTRRAAAGPPADRPCQGAAIHD
jgi:hypothetical protein